MRHPKLRNTSLVWFLILLCAWCPTSATAVTPKWTESKANVWYTQQGWLIGANYAPASAINQLEMWQAETFDPQRIDRELGWAAGIGMNTMRVFLHDLLWQQDAKGFTRRINTFLDICERHRIRPMLVLFDSVWDPVPRLGAQRAPRPGVHNSGWVQSPGAQALQNPAEYPRLETYVKGVVAAFKNDRRILAWDVWNEPDNLNHPNYTATEAKNKEQLILQLLPQVFRWTRAADPSQPVTCGVWKGDYSTDEKMDAIQRVQLTESDVISFHSYDPAPEMEKRIRWLKRYQRPILCTEYMARGNRSVFAEVLPILKRENVAAYNWGLVKGKTQTHLPWDSWERPYTDREPWIWFHEVFREDGTPYLKEETDLIKRLSKATNHLNR